jgi:hypothetical protein
VQPGMRRICFMLLLSLSTLLSTALANSVVLKQVLPEATVIGSGSFRWFGLKLYDASLWAVRSSFNSDNWQSTPLALELNYARSLEGRRIAEASIDEMKKLGIGTSAQHKAWDDAMKQIFPDVDKTTQLTGLYVPGQPTRFFRNGSPVGEITDPAFGAAFFAIWLHPKTTAPKLRSALLGQ